jgi:hypothetical protein
VESGSETDAGFAVDARVKTAVAETVVQLAVRRPRRIALIVSENVA